MFKKTLTIFCVIAIASAALNAATLAHWKFDEGSGQALLDEGGDSSMTLVRGTSSTGYKDCQFTNESVSGTALSFDSTQVAAFEAGDSPETHSAGLVTDTFTVEGFINLNSLPEVNGEYYVLSLWEPTGAANYQVKVSTTSSGDTHLKTTYTNAGSSSWTNRTYTGVAMQTGEWYYVAAIHDAENNTLTLRVNDQSVTFDDVADARTTGEEMDEPFFALGGLRTATGWSSRGYDGLLDEVRISDTVVAENDLLINTIPEPATMSILSLGAFLVGKSRRK